MAKTYATGTALGGKGTDFDRDIAGFSPRQLDAIAALDDPLFKYLLYGGALGGGKSYLLRWAAARQLIRLFKTYNIQNIVGMVACENYPALKDRQLQKIATEFPPWLGKMHNDHKVYGRCFILAPKFGGGVIAFRNLDDTAKYQSAEFAFIFVDELTKSEYEVFTFLRSRLRYPRIPDFECKFMGATNPGSVGHSWVKALWISRIFSDDWKGFEDRFKYIPSKAMDNPHLDNDYYKILDTLPQALRKAFRDGSWDIFVGQAFPEFMRETHVLPDSTPIPQGAQCYMTFDWGFGKPFSVGWWYVGNDGEIVRFDEWYGWDGTPNQGLRLSDSQIAQGIVDREKRYPTLTFIRISGNDVFNKKPDYKGGGRGKSTSEVFASFGIHMTPGDSLRTLKIRQFRERLLPRDGHPMLLVYNRCQQFIRTIPDLVMESRTFEDVDTNGEDHVYDESCNLCMARPLMPEERETKSSEVDKRLDGLEEGEHDQFTDFERMFNGRSSTVSEYDIVH